MELISKSPHLFQLSEKSIGIYKCVITSQTIAYYRIDSSQKEVEIIAVIDSRRGFRL